jgi:hypothetical protein
MMEAVLSKFMSGIREEAERQGVELPPVSSNLLEEAERLPRLFRFK